MIEFNIGDRVKSLKYNKTAVVVDKLYSNLHNAYMYTIRFEDIAVPFPRAVFGNEIMAGKYQVGGGFAVTGIGIHIAAQQAAGLGTYHLTAIFCGTDDFVSRGQIYDDGCPCHGMAGGWLYRCK